MDQLAQQVMENASVRRGKPSLARRRRPRRPRAALPVKEDFSEMTLQVCPSVKQFLKDARKAERERIKAARAQFLTSKKGASQ